MAARVKNTASADDFKRALLLKVPKMDPAQYMHLCSEKIATSYLEFMLYVLEEVTPRLTARFATAIYGVMKEAGLRSKSFKTGEKFKPNMTRNCLALQEQGVGLETLESSTTSYGRIPTLLHCRTLAKQHLRSTFLLLLLGGVNEKFSAIDTILPCHPLGVRAIASR